jgi:1,4-dihydroxy-2-naphthoate octaprenyltransferase
MKNISKEWRDALTHLRVHFSFLLLPVYLFALSQASEIDVFNAVTSFIILHFLIYPSSNLFNSYYDKDEGSVGGLKNPPPTNEKMLSLANWMDLTALILSFFISSAFAILAAIYILFSRLYSYEYIRLKKFPFLGFLVIFVFQGGFTFMLCKFGIVSYFDSHHLYNNHHELGYLTFAALATSFQIGAVYPLTQIYQHKSDLNDGVVTLSYKLGYLGTFLFSAIMFGFANWFYYLHFKEISLESFYLIIAAQLPVMLYFIIWFLRVLKNRRNADYRHTMLMNILAATCLNIIFLYLVIS